MHPILQRLKERKLVQWALAYLAGAFVALQLMDALQDPLGLSQGVQQTLLVLLLMGFSIALVLAWYHGEQGRQRVSGTELLVLGGLVGVSLLAVRSIDSGRTPEVEATPQRLALLFHPRQAPTASLDISPDGSLLVMWLPDSQVAGRLWIKRADAVSAEPIPGSEDGRAPVFSPLGDEIAFITAEDGISVAPVDGGLTRRVADDGAVLCCLRWGPDAEDLYFTEAVTQNVRRVSAEGGSSPAMVLERREDQDGFMGFQLLPGKEVAVYARRGGTIEAIRMGDPERPAILVTEGVHPIVTPTGHLVYASAEGDIVAAKFDAERLVLGPRVPIIADVGRPSSDAQFNVSASGDLFYWSGGQPQSEMVWMEREGDSNPVDSTWSFPGGARWELSPDESRLVVTRSGEGAGSDIWVKNLPDGPFVPVSVRRGSDSNPHWYGNDSIIYRWGNSLDGFDVFVRDANGAGEERLFHDGERPVSDAFVRGDWLLIRTAGGGGSRLPFEARDIIAKNLVSQDVVDVVASGGSQEMSPALSPDGRWLAYAANPAGEFQVFVRPFPEWESDRVQISVEGGMRPTWSKSGDELYYVEPGTRQVFAVEFNADSTFETLGNEPLFVLGEEYRVGRGLTTIDVSRDGRFLVARRKDTSQTLILIQNWFTELNRLVPN